MIKTHFDIYKYKNGYGVITYKDAVVGDYSFGIDNIVDISDIRLFVEHLQASDEYKANTHCPESNTVDIRRPQMLVEIGDKHYQNMSEAARE